MFSLSDDNLEEEVRSPSPMPCAIDDHLVDYNEDDGIALFQNTQKPLPRPTTPPRPQPRRPRLQQSPRPTGRYDNGDVNDSLNASSIGLFAPTPHNPSKIYDFSMMDEEDALLRQTLSVKQMTSEPQQVGGGV